MAARWSALPTWWIRQKRLGDFTGGNQAGRSISAVKVLFALSLLADFRTRKIKCSLSDLETLTGLSRPMVITGTSALEKMGVVMVDRSGHVNVYELLVTDEDSNWGKLPYELLRSKRPAKTPSELQH